MDGESYTPATHLLGDFNADFSVDFDDTLILSPNFDQPPPANGFSYSQGNLTIYSQGDGGVDFDDILGFSTQFGRDLYPPSDFNKDWRVDNSDLSQIVANFGATGLPAGTPGDANGDGAIDIDDWDIFESSRVLGGTIPEYELFGDLNGDLQIGLPDALILAANLNGTDTPYSYLQGDLTGDGLVTTEDSDFFIQLASTPYIPMDLQQDGDVDRDDLTAFIPLLGQGAHGDFDGNGTTDLDDLMIFSQWWGYNKTATNVQSDLGGMIVPEASSLGLLLPSLTPWARCFFFCDRKALHARK